MSINPILFTTLFAQSEADLAVQAPAGDQKPANQKKEKAAGTNDVGDFIGESSCMEPDIGRTIAFGNALKAAEKSACGENDYNVRLDAPPPGGIDITYYNCPEQEGKVRMRAKLTVNRAICSDGRLMFFDSATLQWQDRGIVPELAPQVPPKPKVTLGNETKLEIQKVCRAESDLNACMRGVADRLIDAVAKFAEPAARSVGIQTEELVDKMLSKVWRQSYYLTSQIDSRLAPVARQISQKKPPLLASDGKTAVQSLDELIRTEFQLYVRTQRPLL